MHRFHLIVCVKLSPTEGDLICNAHRTRNLWTLWALANVFWAEVGRWVIRFDFNSFLIHWEIILRKVRGIGRKRVECMEANSFYEAFPSRLLPFLSFGTMTSCPVYDSRSDQESGRNADYWGSQGSRHEVLPIRRQRRPYNAGVI